MTPYTIIQLDSHEFVQNQFMPYHHLPQQMFTSNQPSTYGSYSASYPPNFPIISPTAFHNNQRRFAIPLAQPPHGLCEPNVHQLRYNLREQTLTGFHNYSQLCPHVYQNHLQLPSATYNMIQNDEPGV